MANLDKRVQVIKNPVLILMDNSDGMIKTVVIPRPTDTHMHFGMMIADSVRHIAKAFGVSDAEVWEWVDKERLSPTTDIVTLPDQTDWNAV
jgi:hypothetical protein